MSIDSLSGGSGYSQDDLQLFALMNQLSLSGVQGSQAADDGISYDGISDPIDTVEISDEAKALAQRAVRQNLDIVSSLKMEGDFQKNEDFFSLLAREFRAMTALQDTIPDFMKNVDGRHPLTFERGYGVAQFFDGSDLYIVDDFFGNNMLFSNIEERDALYDYIVGKASEAGVDVEGRMQISVEVLDGEKANIAELNGDTSGVNMEYIGVSTSVKGDIGNRHAEGFHNSLSSEERATIEELFSNDDYVKRTLLGAQLRYAPTYASNRLTGDKRTIDELSSEQVANIMEQGRAVLAERKSQQDAAAVINPILLAELEAVRAERAAMASNGDNNVEAVTPNDMVISESQTRSGSSFVAETKGELYISQAKSEEPLTELTELPGQEVELSESLWSSVKDIGELFGFKNVKDRKELISLLESKIDKSRDKLQTKIVDLLDEKNITLNDDERISFSIGGDGQIKVEGIEDEEKRAEIEKVLNEDEELGKELYMFAATQSVLQSFKANLTVGEATRRAFVENILNEKGMTFDDISDTEDGRYALENLGLSSLQVGEIFSVKSLNVEQMTVDLEFQNGTLVNPDEIAHAHSIIADLFDKTAIEHPVVHSLVDAIDYFNNMADEEARIKGFDFSLSKDGVISVNDEELNRGDGAMIESWFGDDFTEKVQMISDALMLEHQAEFGDVDDYEHDIVFHVDTLSGVTADIESEEADEAAREEIAESADKFTKVFSNYYAEEYDSVLPVVELEMNEAGVLSVKDMGDSLEMEQIERVVDMLNLALRQDDSSVLPDGLKSAVEHLNSIHSSVEKIHNKDERSAVIMLGA